MCIYVSVCVCVYMVCMHARRIAVGERASGSLLAPMGGLQGKGLWVFAACIVLLHCKRSCCAEGFCCDGSPLGEEQAVFCVVAAVWGGRGGALCACGNLGAESVSWLSGSWRGRRECTGGASTLEIFSVSRSKTTKGCVGGVIVKQGDKWSFWEVGGDDVSLLLGPTICCGCPVKGWQVELQVHWRLCG